MKMPDLYDDWKAAIENDPYLPRNKTWRTKDGRTLTIGEMVDSHLNNAILAALRNDGTVRVSKQTLRMLAREQLRRWLGPWSETVQDLLRAVINNQKCEFALHDAVCEEGYPKFAGFVLQDVLTVEGIEFRYSIQNHSVYYQSDALRAMIQEGKVVPFTMEWEANHAASNDYRRNERKLPIHQEEPLVQD